MDAKSLQALPQAKVRFIEPMYALTVQKLPEGKKWLYEVKFDGYRCLAGRDSTKVTLWSRRENLFTDQFAYRPGLECLPVDTLLDGEIVALDENGRSHSICCCTTAQKRRRCSSPCLTCWHTSARAS
jgi:ATP-dependent DNA ligase